MKFKLIVTTIMLFSALTVSAQNTSSANTTTIKGTLIDSATNKGESFATINIVSKNAPNVSVKMAVTDDSGKFSEKISVRGDFILIASVIGKKTVTKEFSVNETDKTVDLGTLHISDDVQQLGGAMVVAQKPLVKVDLDKLEYSVEDDPDSKTNSTLEMLRKVPMVTVDGEDNIQVNGSSSFKVHINGKPNNMISQNPSDVLKSMPANTIKKIEVITNPGAKYDAEGTSGILNIITVGGGFEGYTATFRAGVSNIALNGGVYASIKKGNLTISTNYSYTRNKRPPFYIDTYRENYESNSEKYLLTHQTSNNSGNFQYGNIDASYEIDTLRLLSMSFGMFGGNPTSSRDGFTEMQDNNSNPVYSYSQNGNSKSSWYSIDGSVDYQRSFKTKGRLLTFSYRISTNPETADAYSRYSDDVNVPAILQLSNRRSNDEQSTTEHTFQADYTTPIGKLHTIETGAKYIIRDNVSNDKYYSAPLNTENFQYIDSMSSHYKHLNDILAAYAGYTLKYKKVSLKAGVRYEHTSQDIEYIVGLGKNFNVALNDIVPSLSAGIKLSDTKNLRFGYNMRIQRPSIYYLNPYVNITNPVNISYGNPDLKTQKAHVFNVNYSSFTAKLSINVSLSYHFGSNSIDRISFIKDNVQHNTYANIGQSNITVFNFYTNWNITPKTRINLNSRLSYSDFDNDASNLHNSGWNADAFVGIQHTFPLKIRASMNVGGMTPGINLQGRSSAFHYYTLSVNRSFLKEDRLSIGISARNFLNRQMSQKSVTEGVNFRYEGKATYSQYAIGFNINYRLGNLKASVKKASRTIVNDDVKSGEGSSSGGGEN
ncbi:MAG: TonB-dependent receptor [Prevotellaceae bacterium]|jgi:hypothetical protein|nr:TonB-dependent receptor [Prevotellaceae bacterium]